MGHTTLILLKPVGTTRLRRYAILTQEFLKEHLEYRDGHLWWVKSTANNVKVGQQFGCYDNKGYRIGKLKGKLYKEHRLIWLYHNSKWPEDQLDHINGIKDDNRIENLREATAQQNQFNKKSWGKTSTYKGVYWQKQHKKWRAHYYCKSKPYHVGYYETEAEAAEAYRKATEHLHKDYANYG